MKKIFISILILASVAMQAQVIRPTNPVTVQSGTVTVTGTVNVTGLSGGTVSATVTNWPALQTVTGTVTVDGLSGELTTPPHSYMPATHWSPADGAMAFTTTSTITASGFPFTVDVSTCNIRSIGVTRTDGSMTLYENGIGGYSITASNNVITLKLNGVAVTSGFLSSDVKYAVAICYQTKGYDLTTDATKTSEISPLWSRYVVEATSDQSNVATSTTYYPSSDGLEMAGYKDISIMMVTSGSVTTTIEITNDDAASPDWVDITKVAYDLITGTDGASSFVDATAFLNFDNLNCKAIRIKSVTGDNSNAVQYNIRRKY